RTTFASGLASPFALAFDSRGNLFVADGGTGYDIIVGAAVYKFTPSGLRSTVASENDQVSVIPNGLAIDTADNLFVSDGVTRSILKFTPSGVRTTFASRFVTAMAFQPKAAPTDFNNDGKPDYLLYNASTHQTALWYLNNNVHVAGASGPTLPAGWRVAGVGDFNRDRHPGYLLFNPATRQTAIWYLNNNTRIGAASRPTLPTSWESVATGDFNKDGKPDWVLHNPSTQQTAIWYFNNNVHIGGAYGPTLPAGYSLV